MSIKKHSNQLLSVTSVGIISRGGDKKRTEKLHRNWNTKYFEDRQSVALVETWSHLFVTVEPQNHEKCKLILY